MQKEKVRLHGGADILEQWFLDPGDFGPRGGIGPCLQTCFVITGGITVR